MANKLSLAGNQKSVPAYYEGQPTDLSPDHYETREEANRLKASGKARSINRGRAILIRGPRRFRQGQRDSIKKAWKVVGQTAKRLPDGPGFPRYNSI